MPRLKKHQFHPGDLVKDVRHPDQPPQRVFDLDREATRQNRAVTWVVGSPPSRLAKLFGAVVGSLSAVLGRHLIKVG